MQYSQEKWTHVCWQSTRKWAFIASFEFFFKFNGWKLPNIPCVWIRLNESYIAYNTPCTNAPTHMSRWSLKSSTLEILLIMTKKMLMIFLKNQPNRLFQKASFHEVVHRGNHQWEKNKIPMKNRESHTFYPIQKKFNYPPFNFFTSFLPQILRVRKKSFIQLKFILGRNLSFDL